MLYDKRALLKVIATVAIVALSLAALDKPANAAPEVTINISHAGYTRAVAFSPNGQLILSGSDDGTIKIWDVKSSRLVRTLDTVPSGTIAVSILQDGRRGLSAHDDGRLRLWDLTSGAVLRTFGGDARAATSLSISPNGSRVLSGSDDFTAKLWDIGTGQLLRTFATKGAGAVSSVVLLPDGHTALSGGFGKPVYRWDIATGKVIQEYKGHSNTVESVAISPDMRTALSSSSDNTMKLWDIATGRMLRSFGGKRIFYSATFFGGMTVLSVGEGGFQEWDVTSGQLRRTFTTGSRGSIAVSPDERIAAVGGDRGLLELWDLASGRLMQTLSDSGGAAFVFGKDGRSIISARDNNPIRIWDLFSGSLLKTFAGNGLTSGLALSADGRTLTTGNQLWDVESGAKLHELDAYGAWGASSFSADGRLVLKGGGFICKPKLFDVASGKMLRELNMAFERGRQWCSVSISPELPTALVGTRGWLGDGTDLGIWDLRTGQLIRALSDNAGTNALEFSADGRTALSGHSSYIKFAADWHTAASRHQGTMKLWEVPSGRLVHSFEANEIIPAVSFSPDGLKAASGGHLIKLWDIKSGRLLQSLNDHSGLIQRISFSPDRQALIAASYDGTARIWDLKTGDLLLTMAFFDAGEWIRFTPEGFFDASRNAGYSVSIARELAVYSVDQFYDALHRPDLVQAKLAGDPQGKVREAAARLNLAKAVASGNAPSPRITSPPAGATVSDEQVSVESIITDQGGGIGRVEWRVNGVTAGVEERGIKRVEVSGSSAISSASQQPTLTVSRTLPLEPGENRISVVAYNAAGLIASNPAEVTVKREGGRSSTPPRLYVLAVGINDYWDSRLRLSYAASDAKALGEAFQQGGKGPLYGGVEVTTVLDEGVTIGNLDKVFTDLGKKVRSQDVFVFFVAGHGKTVDGRYYFIPQDFRYAGEESIISRGIGQDQLQKWFARILAQKSVLLFDACESGSLIGDRLTMRGLEEKAAIDRLTRAMGRTVLTATTDDKPAIEGYRGHGVFTYVLLDGLWSADKNGNGLIEVNELVDYVEEQVPDLSYAAFGLRQVPTKNLQGNNFPLASKVAILPGSDTAPAAVIAAKPTHVVIAQTTVRQTADHKAAAVTELAPGAQVQLVETMGSWVLIARDGKRLGYVDVKALAGLQ
jgi:WD40 repeat protein/uncharacterized caspase-like protein